MHREYSRLINCFVKCVLWVLIHVVFYEDSFWPNGVAENVNFNLPLLKQTKFCSLVTASFAQSFHNEDLHHIFKRHLHVVTSIEYHLLTLNMYNVRYLPHINVILYIQHTHTPFSFVSVQLEGGFLPLVRAIFAWYTPKLKSKRTNFA